MDTLQAIQTAISREVEDEVAAPENLTVLAPTISHTMPLTPTMLLAPMQVCIREVVMPVATVAVMKMVETQSTRKQAAVLITKHPTITIMDIIMDTIMDTILHNSILMDNSIVSERCTNLPEDLVLAVLAIHRYLKRLEVVSSWLEK